MVFVIAVFGAMRCSVDADGVTSGGVLIAVGEIEDDVATSEVRTKIRVPIDILRGVL